MEEASQVRCRAREAIQDIGPERFHDEVAAVIEGGSMAPGVLVVLCARAIDDSVGFETVAERAAGTQLIYEGLRMTRALARAVPWAEDGEDADIDVLAADVLVARGFYLLARTETAGRAVETVQNFGRDQTRQPADEATENHLEADVFELAAVAGMTAVGAHPSAACSEFVADLARSADAELPPANALFGASVRESLRAHAEVPPETAGDGRATTATDP